MAVSYGTQVSTNDLVFYLDAGNYKSFSTNTFSSSLDLYTWYVSKRGNNTGNTCTVEQDFSTDRSPAGGIPMKMNVTGNDPHIGSYNAATWNISTALNGQTWRVSFYAKASTTLNNCEVYIFGANSSGNAAISGGGWYGITAKTITVTPQWQRFDHFITFSNADVAFIQMRLDGPNSGGAGTTVWWDGLQVERTSSLTAFKPQYNPNGSSWFDLISRNPGTLINAVSYTDANSGSLVFDGVNDYVSIANNDSMRPATELTVECVIYPTSTPASWSQLIGYGQADYTNGNYLLFLETGTTLCRALARVNNTEYRCNTSYTAPLNQYTFITFTMKCGDAIRSYFNGVPNITTSLPAGTFTYNGTTSAYQIGSPGGSWYPGRISIMRMYSRALTATEVFNNFNSLRGRYGI